VIRGRRRCRPPGGARCRRGRGRRMRRRGRRGVLLRVLQHRGRGVGGGL